MMSRFIQWGLAVAILVAAVAACSKKSSSDDGPPPAPPSAPPPSPPASVVVDLDVDSNRNGTVQNPTDETGEDGWTPSLGAVFYFNIDDDDNNNSTVPPL